MPLLSVSSVIFSLILNESVIALPTVKSVIALAAKTGSSLEYCYKITNFLNSF